MWRSLSQSLASDDRFSFPVKDALEIQAGTRIWYDSFCVEFTELILVISCTVWVLFLWNCTDFILVFGYGSAAVEQRKAEAERVRQKYPNRIPVTLICLTNISISYGFTLSL